jgi:epsilon-lactone hydrolase
MLRFLLRLVLLLIRTIVGVFFRRTFRGPKHPSWTYKTECLATFLRQQLREMMTIGPAMLKKYSPAAPQTKMLRSAVRLESSTIGQCQAEIHTPNGWTPADGTLLYFHGGGYSLCSPATHRELVSRISFASRMRAVALDYRLAPSHPFPHAVEDALSAYEHLLSEGCQPEKICLGGDSAGGGLTLATLLSLRDKGRPLPKGAVLLSPWVDLTCQGASIDGNAPFDYLSRKGLETFASQYAPPEKRKDPLISPLFADLHDLPPMLVQTGSAELFFSENMDFVNAAKSAGCNATLEVSEGMFHVWQAFARFLPEGRFAIASMGFYLREQMTRQNPKKPPAG